MDQNLHLARTPIHSDKVAETVFMVSFHKDNFIFLHQAENIVLQLLRFLPAVKQVSADDDILTAVLAGGLIVYIRSPGETRAFLHFSSHCQVPRTSCLIKPIYEIVNAANDRASRPTRCGQTSSRLCPSGR